MYDSKGNLYEIPNYCINPPYKFIESSFDKSFEDKPIDLRIRCNMTEYKLKVNTNLCIKQLKEIILKNLKEKEIEKVRIFHGGKELKDKNNLHRFDNNAIFQMITVKKDFIEPYQTETERGAKSVKQESNKILGELDTNSPNLPSSMKSSKSSLKQKENFDNS